MCGVKVKIYKCHECDCKVSTKISFVTVPFFIGKKSQMLLSAPVQQILGLNFYGHCFYIFSKHIQILRFHI